MLYALCAIGGAMFGACVVLLVWMMFSASRDQERREFLDQMESHG